MLAVSSSHRDPKLPLDDTGGQSGQVEIGHSLKPPQ